MNRRVTKRGHNDWADLRGKTIQFEFHTPWEDDSDRVTLDFSHTQYYYEDPRYPRYYVMDEEGGGYSFWEDDEVEVEILD